MTIRELRQTARQIWEAALNGANAAACIRRSLQVNDGVISVGGKEIDIRGRVIVVGAGKPAAKMAQTVEEILAPHITSGLVITKYGHSVPLRRIELMDVQEHITSGDENAA